MGRVIDDRYRVVEKLGEGGMGAVFVAEHLKLQKQVALKVILPELAGDSDLAARFAREAMVTAKLDHPHVASAIDFGTLPEGGAYLVMQLVRGPSLRAMLDRYQRAAWPKACAIAAQIADALAAAHSVGIVHRDLKPENVLLELRDDGSELVKVLDFGIARAPDHDRGKPDAPSMGALTRVGTIIGTPGYMAPEQALGEPVDARADLYALGVVLWEMICGRRLWDTGQDITELFTRQITQTPPSLRAVTGDPTIPPELERLVAQLLARSRTERPERASHVRDALRALSMHGALAGSLPAAGVGSSGNLPAFRTSAPWLPVDGGAGTVPATDLAAASRRGEGESAAMNHAAVGGTAEAAVGGAVDAAIAGPGSGVGGGTASSLPMAHAVGALPTLHAAATPLGGDKVVAPAGRPATLPATLAARVRTLPIPVLAVGCTAPLVGAAVLGLVLRALLGGGEAAPVEAGAGSAGHAGSAGGPPLVVPLVLPSPPERPEVPPELEDDVGKLLHADARSRRQAAAREILRYEHADQLPPYLRLLAELELAQGCRGKRPVVQKLRELGDPRALESVERVASVRGSSGGLFGIGATEDIYACMRRELEATVTELRAAAGRTNPGDRSTATH
jgi:serine/threonine-protein kinase